MFPAKQKNRIMIGIVLLIVYLIPLSLYHNNQTNEFQIGTMPKAAENFAPAIMEIQVPNEILLGISYAFNISYTDDSDYGYCMVYWRISNSSGVIQTAEGVNLTTWNCMISPGFSLPGINLVVEVYIVDLEMTPSNTYSAYTLIRNRAPVIESLELCCDNANYFLNSTYTCTVAAHDEDGELIHGTLQLWTTGALEPWAISSEIQNESQFNFSFSAYPGINWTTDPKYPHPLQTIYAKVVICDLQTEVTETTEASIVTILPRSAGLLSLYINPDGEGLWRSDSELSHTLEYTDPDGGSPTMIFSTWYYWGTDLVNHSYEGGNGDYTFPANTARVGDSLRVKVVLYYLYKGPQVFFSDIIVLDAPLPVWHINASWKDRYGQPCEDFNQLYVDIQLKFDLNITNFDLLTAVNGTIQYFSLRNGVQIIWLTRDFYDSAWYSEWLAINSTGAKAGDYLGIIMTIRTALGMRTTSVTSPFPIQNAPPYLIEVSIPAAIYKNMTDVPASIIAHDPDGNPIYYQIEWYRNGILLSYAGWNLPISQVAHNNLISFRVRVGNGSQWSDWVSSGAVLVRNCAPVIVNAVFAAHPSRMFPISVSNITSFDADSDNIRLRYQFEINGAALPIGESPILTTDNYKRGDCVIVRIFAIDDYDLNSSFQLGLIIVENSAPIIANISFSGDRFYSDVPFAIVAEYSDSDNDNLTISYFWYINDALYTINGLPYNASTLDPRRAHLSIADEVYCIVKISDNFTNTEIKSESIIILGPSSSIQDWVSFFAIIAASAGILGGIALFFQKQNKFRERLRMRMRSGEKVAQVNSIQTTIGGIKNSMKFYMFKAEGKEYRSLGAEGAIFPDHIEVKTSDAKEASIVPARSGVDLNNLVAGDHLLAFVSNGELVPLPRKKLVADPLREPTFVSVLQSTKLIYSQVIDKMKGLLTKLKDPRNSQDQLEQIFNTFLEMEKSGLNSELSNVLSHLPNLGTKTVNFANIQTGKGVFFPIEIQTLSGNVEAKGRFDTAAEIALISEDFAARNQFQPPIATVSIRGVTDGMPISASVIRVHLTIKGKKLATNAAIFPNLEQKVGAPFLIDEMIYRQGKDAGIIW